MMLRRAAFVSSLVPGAFALTACSPAAGEGSAPQPVITPPVASAGPTASASASAEPASREARCPAQHPIGRVAFGPDGQTLATASGKFGVIGDGTGNNLVDVWDVPSGKIARSLDAGQDDVAAVSFGNNGWLVTVTGPPVATVRLFSVADWSMKHDMSFYCAGTAHWSPAGTHLGIVGCDGQMSTVRLSDRKVTERPKDEAHLGGDYRVDMEYSADGKSIYVDDEDQGFQVLDAATLKRRSRRLPPERTACSALSPKHDRFAWVTEEGALSVLETASANKKPKKLATDEEHPCSALAWVDTSHFAVATADGEVKIWDATGKDAARALSPAADAGAPAFLVADATGAALAGAHPRGHVSLWDVAAGTHKELFHSPSSPGPDAAPPPSIQWSPDGARLAAAAGDRYFLWDRSGNKLAESPIRATESGAGLIWSPRGDVVAVLDGSLHLHRVSDGADLTLVSIDQNGARLGLAGSSSGAFAGPPELAHCALPAGTPASRRVQRPTLLADFLNGLPLRGQ